MEASARGGLKLTRENAQEGQSRRQELSSASKVAASRFGLKRKSSWSGFVRVRLLALADPNLQEICTAGSRWITSISVDEVTAIVSPQSR